RPEALLELGVHELDPVQEPVEVGPLLGSHQRQVELVQDLQEAADEGLGGHLDGARLLLQHPLAVVVELGGQALQVLPELCRFLSRGFELVLRLWSFGLGRVGGSLVDPNPPLVGYANARAGFVLVMRMLVLVAHELPPSSTISPSTTSPSASGEDASFEPPAGLPPPPAAAWASLC